ncbi:MAG: hypothetical protein II954_02685, partial [Synergistaceae bacterium]|nr:hypothetical protein [Synergistaceae bacterium]
REEQARIAGDADLQGQIDKTAEASLNNALNIHHEAEQRRKSDELIEALKDESSRQSDIDAHHQRQIDAAVLAILQNSLTLSEALALRRKALTREEQARHNEDVHQQAQIDTNASVNIQNSLNIQQEAQQRRKVLDRLNDLRQDTLQQIQTLRSEMGLLYEIPLPGLYEQLSGLQAQANLNAEASITNTLHLSREVQQRRELAGTLSEADTFHQEQIDALISAVLENSVNLHAEVSRRIESVRQERSTRFEEDTALHDEIDTVAQAVMRNILALNDALSHQREAMSQQTKTLTEHETGILRQINALAEADIWRLVNEHDSRLSISKVMQRLQDIPARKATDAFTTTADFVEGAGKKHSAGSNVVIVETTTAVFSESSDSTVNAEKTYYVSQNGGYSVVTPAGNENPATEGWYKMTTPAVYKFDVHAGDLSNVMELAVPAAANSIALLNAQGQVIDSTLKIATDAEFDEMLAELYGN